MDIQDNARTTRHGRMLMVQRLASGWTVAAVPPDDRHDVRCRETTSYSCTTAVGATAPLTPASAKGRNPPKAVLRGPHPAANRRRMIRGRFRRGGFFDS
jgi:hypothetical protein